MKLVKPILKIIPFISAVVGVFTLALAKYEENQGNYSRNFGDIESDLKNVISEVRK